MGHVLNMASTENKRAFHTNQGCSRLCGFLSTDNCSEQDEVKESHDLPKGFG